MCKKIFFNFNQNPHTSKLHQIFSIKFYGKKSIFVQNPHTLIYIKYILLVQFYYNIPIGRPKGSPNKKKHKKRKRGADFNDLSKSDDDTGSSDSDSDSEDELDEPTPYISDESNLTGIRNKIERAKLHARDGNILMSNRYYHFQKEPKGKPNDSEEQKRRLRCRYGMYRQAAHEEIIFLNEFGNAYMVYEW